MHRAIATLTLIALAGACAPAAPPPAASRAPRPPPEIVAPPPRGWATVRIEGVPHVRQKPDFCGEACVSMALGKLGRPLDQDEVFNRALVDPALGRGVVAHELDRVLRRLGFDPGPVWFPVEPASAGAELDSIFAALHADLAAGIPSIVGMRFDEAPRASEHFRLIVGYDAATDEILYHEPARDEGAYRRMSRATFYRLWPLGPSAEVWTAIRFRLAPASPSSLDRAAPARHAGFTDAEYAQHVLALRRALGTKARDFTIVVERPFVVLGDGDPAAVRALGAHTVRWAVARLKEAYFTKDPPRIIDVWLFRDRQSYEGNALSLFREKPPTTFGYYSSGQGALLMNIATGRGTLVHELVHPFVEVDLPGCPPWINEGLGSLYEYPGEEEGRIWGYTNWRLTGLQKAIKERRLAPIESVIAAGEEAFYGEGSVTHYAVARYLLYYLQAKGLLVRFYRDYRAGRAEDPTGVEALRRVLGERDLTAFQKRWEAFVMDLVFPQRLEVISSR